MGSSLRGALALAVLATGCGSSPEAVTDGGLDGGGPDGATARLAPVLYPGDRTLSPLTPDLVEHLRAIHAASTGSDRVFAKIGDSHTVSTSYLACFVGAAVDLGGRDLAATVAQFAGSDAAGTSAFARTSLAATIGWAAFQALAGTPTPIDQELAAITPAFATVMFGTNDIGYGRIDRFGRNLATIADGLLAQGIIPVLSTIPPRDDSATADAEVPHYNAIARGIAQTRGVPLVDLHRELVVLPGHGLGGDGLHLESAPAGACQLTPTGLTHGNNLRNLHVLTTLDRLRRTVLAGEPAPDPDAPRLAGAGSPTDPFEITALPFADRRDTRTFGVDQHASYPPCGTQDQRGNEVYYRLELAAPATLQAYAIDADADIDLQLLAGAPTADACVVRADTTLVRRVEPGVYYLVADTYQGLAGDYTLVVTVD